MLVFPRSSDKCRVANALLLIGVVYSGYCMAHARACATAQTREARALRTELAQSWLVLLQALQLRCVLADAWRVLSDIMVRSPKLLLYYEAPLSAHRQRDHFQFITSYLASYIRNFVRLASSYAFCDSRFRHSKATACYCTSEVSCNRRNNLRQTH